MKDLSFLRNIRGECACGAIVDGWPGDDPHGTRHTPQGCWDLRGAPVQDTPPTVAELVQEMINEADKLGV